MSIYSVYDYGALVRVSDTVTTGTPAVAADAATVTLTVHPPTGADVAYTLAASQVVRDGVGLYHYDINANQAGTWGYTWTTTSPQSAFYSTFTVRPAML